MWRLRDFFEVLVTCRQEPDLASLSPSEAPEGGLQIPRTEETSGVAVVVVFCYVGCCRWAAYSQVAKR
ncbi:unnamed protein product, partial [Polarella glacialis]